MCVFVCVCVRGCVGLCVCGCVCVSLSLCGCGCGLVCNRIMILFINEQQRWSWVDNSKGGPKMIQNDPKWLKILNIFYKVLIVSLFNERPPPVRWFGLVFVNSNICFVIVFSQQFSYIQWVDNTVVTHKNESPVKEVFFLKYKNILNFVNTTLAIFSDRKQRYIMVRICTGTNETQ